MAQKKNFKVDLVKKTIVITAEYERQMNENPYSVEAKEFRSLLKELKGFEVIKPKRKTTSNNKNLTYKDMEKYISVFENRDELMEMFNLAKSLSLVQPNPYNFVKGWFKEQFPNYKEMPKVSKDGKLYAFPIVPKAEETEKAEELKVAYNF